MTEGHTPRYFRPSQPKAIVTSKKVVPLLIFTSHAHVPPLSPAHRLKYDLRSTPNPPKTVRDAHNGMSKRLREYMLDHDSFCDMLDKAEADVKEKMPAAQKAFEAGEIGFTPTSPVLARRRTWSQQKYSDDEEDEDEEHEDDEDEETETEDTTETDKEVEKDRPVLRVSAFCERGQHRSVAFVEELATREWPKDWEVRIVHRDLGKKRAAIGGGKAKSKKPPVRSASYVLDDD